MIPFEENIAYHIWTLLCAKYRFETDKIFYTIIAASESGDDEEIININYEQLTIIMMNTYLLFLS